MRLQLIRNATLKLHYGGRTLLVDPFLARRNALPSYAGHSRNPLVDLPLVIEEIRTGVEVGHRLASASTISMALPKALAAYSSAALPARRRRRSAPPASPT